MTWLGRLKQMKPAHRTAAGLAVLAVAWILSGVFVGDKSRPAPGGALAPSEVLVDVKVRTVTAKIKSRKLVLFGRTEADRGVNVKAETAGRVVGIEVAKGSAVKAGRVIVRLAMDDRARKLAEAEAIFNEKSISYKAARQLSKENYRSKVKLAESKANFEKARAGLAAVRLDIARTAIHAPFDGIADDVPVEVGDYIETGDVVARVIDLDPIVAVGEVSERNAQLLSTGSPARVKFADGRVMEGRVRYRSRSGEPATRTFRIEVAVSNPGAAIVEGLTTEISLEVGKTMAYRLSPAVLTLSGAGEVGVKTVDGDNRVRFYPVRLIADTTEGIWFAGLPEKTRVITVGQEFVKTGQKVRPVEVSTAPG